jgi:hypothetical protein
MVIEFISQANGGTHCIAMNQAAGAGAVAMNGFVELARQGLGLDSIDYNEPQFFFLSMDHQVVLIHVHWLGNDDGKHTLHMEELSAHYLKTPEGIRAAKRAAKNILDWGLNNHLPTICKQLDTFREKVELAIAEKAAAEKKVAEKAAVAAATQGASTKTGPRKGRNRNGQKRKRPGSTADAHNARDEPSKKRVS